MLGEPLAPLQAPCWLLKAEATAVYAVGSVGDSGKRVMGLVPTWGWCCPYLGLRVLGEGCWVGAWEQP